MERIRFKHLRADFEDLRLKAHPSDKKEDREHPVRPRVSAECTRKLKFCVIEKPDTRYEATTNSYYGMTTALTAQNDVCTVWIAENHLRKIQKDKFYRTRIIHQTNGFLRLQKQVNETKPFNINPKRVEEILYPPCTSIAGLSMEKLMTMEIRTRLSVKGYVKKCGGMYDMKHQPKRDFVLMEKESGGATVLVKLWNEKAEIYLQKGTLVQILSVKVVKYKESRQIHSTPSTIINVF
ncbi:uncharacterized protein LOC133179248 [Saccostrea echinata]|uniref:uncharacterized protein LOC133179248 n=1 Tax=Saccostrea echinata TaxID=191078 RepID=UPI002A83F7E3|nr:uncharacterized protein LOC133179248 [Saccostrea echinata]